MSISANKFHGASHDHGLLTADVVLRIDLARYHIFSADKPYNLYLQDKFELPLMDGELVFLVHNSGPIDGEACPLRDINTGIKVGEVVPGGFCEVTLDERAGDRRWYVHCFSGLDIITETETETPTDTDTPTDTPTDTTSTDTATDTTGTGTPTDTPTETETPTETPTDTPPSTETVTATPTKTDPDETQTVFTGTITPPFTDTHITA